MVSFFFLLCWLTMRHQSHNPLPFCHAVFLLQLSRFRIKDFAYLVDPARSKARGTCYVKYLIDSENIHFQVSETIKSFPPVAKFLSP